MTSNLESWIMFWHNLDFLVTQIGKNPPAVQETWVQFLNQEDLLEKRMATHSNILAWKIPWTEKPGGLQSIGSQRVGHNWSDYAHTHIHLCFQLYGHPVNFHVSVAMEFIQQKLIVLHINKYTVCLEKVPAYQILTWSLSLWYEKWNWFFLINYSMFSVKISQSRPTLCNPMGWMVHGVLQARILEGVAFPYSRGSSQPRDQTQVSRIAGRFFTNWAIREALKYVRKIPNIFIWLSLSMCDHLIFSH